MADQFRPDADPALGGATWTGSYAPTQADFIHIRSDIATAGADRNIGGNSLTNVAALKLVPATLPGSPVAGQLCVDASGALWCYNGSAWVSSSSTTTFTAVTISASPAVLTITDTGGTGNIRVLSAGGANYIQSGVNGTADSKQDLVFTSVSAGTEWFRIISASGIVKINGSAWNGAHFQVGVYHLWIDGSGRLRIKSSAPSSDTDGTVVGTQA